MSRFTRTITISLPKEHTIRIRSMAKKTGLSVSAIIRICMDYAFTKKAILLSFNDLQKADPTKREDTP